MLRLLVAQRAWERISREAERRRPAETALYPLAALVPEPAVSPLEELDWDAVSQLVITDVLLPPPEAVDAGPTHVRFFPAATGEASRVLQGQAEELVRQHPRLALLTKLHSHPFPGGDFLSAGDVGCNVQRPASRAWWQERGLAAALLGVVYPGDPWRLACFRVDFAGEIRRFADGVVVPDDDPAVVRALAPPYWRSAAGAAWCDRTKARLRRQGWEVSRNLLPRGWRRLLVRPAGQAWRVLCLPPDLPAAGVRILEVVDAARDRFHLRRVLPPVADLEDLDLVAALAEEAEP